MKNGRTFFLLLMGMVVTLYTAFAVIGQDGPPVDAGGEAPAEADQPADVADEAAPVVAAPVEDAATEAAAVADAPAEVLIEEVPVEEGDPAGAVVVPDPDEVFVGVGEDDDEIPGADAEKQDEQGTISISLDDVEMADVVRMFTRISGANIIASPSNLIGRVTANLDDVHWQSAMETILDMHSLALLESPPGSKIFRIDPKVPGAPEPMKVKTYFLKYAAVSNSTGVISAMLTPGGSLQPFASRNALVIRTTASNLGEIDEIIEAIDVLRDQVFIEAKFMELNDSAIKDLGINWQVMQRYEVSAGNLGLNLGQSSEWTEGRSDNVSLSDDRLRQEAVVRGFDELNNEEASGALSQPDVDQQYSTEGVPTYSYADIVDRASKKTTDISDTFTKAITDVRTAVLGVDDFKLVLSALKQLNGVQVVSNPKIIVANEETAVIHIGQVERPFEAVVQPATQVESSTTSYRPGVPIEFGVKLEVTPTINTASNITVRIMPELTRFVVNTVAPDGATYPIVSRKKIQTMFCLESGKTVAIGGLTETEEQEQTTKVPLLGDIPLIGKYLFSYTHMEKEQKETIIFVTVGLAQPGSVNELDGVPEDTELTHRRLLDSRLRRHEFNQQLEEERQKVEERMEKTERVRSHLMKSK